MPTSHVLPGVQLDPTAVVEEFVILGKAPKGADPASLPTRIGARGLIRSHSVIYAGNTIGDDFQTGHGVLIRERNQIGNRVSIGSGTVVEHHVTIGDGVRIHSQAFIPEFSVLESGVWIGPNVVLTNARYPNTPSTKNQLEGVVLEKDCIIGANATLLPGIRVGAGAIVGAGSVVTRDVPAGMVVTGNPAKVVRRVDALEAYRFRNGEKK